MGSKYSSQSTSGYNAGPPPDDGTQVASNLVTWASVKTKLADVLKTFGEAINTALVSALDLSARAISTPDTAVASDHWKTLQVTGNTTITLSSAASMGAGYEVGIFNAGVGVVTVTPGAAADTINGVSASVTVSIKGTKIFRTNQALTGYNVVGGSDPQTVTAPTSVVTPLVQAAATALVLEATGTNQIQVKTNGVISWAFRSSSENYDLYPIQTDNTQSIGANGSRIKQVVTPIIDTGTTGSGALKTNNGSTQVTWDNNGAIAIGGRASPASGAGVAFPAAQSASTDVNTLDDYEEGTWTPGLAFGGGTTGITYATQNGHYTKVGRQVSVTFEVTITSKGSSTGSATLTGLPFSSMISSDGWASAVAWGGMTSTLVNVTVHKDSSSATATIRGATAATTGLNALTETAFSNTSQLISGFTYYV